MIGGCSRAPHRCTKQHFHDKLAPQQICSAAAAAATAVQLRNTQHLHTDGNDLCGHGDCHAGAHNAFSSFCCCSGARTRSYIGVFSALACCYKKSHTCIVVSAYSVIALVFFFFFSNFYYFLFIL